MTTPDIPVLIVGAGSVGLSLAGELGWRDIPCMLVEKAQSLNPHPRANAVANRTMEYYRRWGIDGRIAQTGIPSDMPGRYFWVSTLAGQKIHQIDLPPPARIQANATGGYASDEFSWSPYLKTITGQDEVERILLDHARSRPSVELHFQTELMTFEDRGDHVAAVLRDHRNGETREVTCRYLVACDGGRSPVRETLGQPMSGRAALARFVSIYFRSAQFLEAGNFGHGNIFFPLHRDYRGFILNWDGRETFTYHLILPEGADWQDVDPVETVRSVVGAPVDVELYAMQPWTAHALTADSYRPSDNIFLAGDAAHLFTPTGGFGMNTGVSDAIDLAWKLQAMLQGWGGDRLLDSYNTERQPVGRRNTSAAATSFDELFACMQHGDELDADTPAASALRDRLRDSLKQQEKLISSSGTLLGYRYEGSPIVVPDGTPEPDDHPRRYLPVVRPGHRAPHLWLEDGRALMDSFGPDFTLLVTDPALMAEAERLARALRDRCVPVDVVAQTAPAVAETYGRGLVLIRPDMMIAWRGDSVPGDAAGLIDRVTGA